MQRRNAWVKFQSFIHENEGWKVSHKAFEKTNDGIGKRGEATKPQNGFHTPLAQDQSGGKKIQFDFEKHIAGRLVSGVLHGISQNPQFNPMAKTYGKDENGKWAVKDVERPSLIARDVGQVSVQVTKNCINKSKTNEDRYGYEKVKAHLAADGYCIKVHLELFDGWNYSLMATPPLERVLIAKVNIDKDLQTINVARESGRGAEFTFHQIVEARNNIIKYLRKYQLVFDNSAYDKSDKAELERLAEKYEFY